MANQQLPLTGVFVQNPVTKGFTVYLTQLPNIIAKGDTKDEAIKNLFHTVQVVFQHQENAKIFN